MGKCQNVLDKFKEAFNTFKTSGSAYWNNFLTKMVPVLRNLTRSFRDTNWYLYLSYVSCAIDLCFSLDRINYKRLLPIYYEDCLATAQTFS